MLRRLKQTQRCPQATGGARLWHLLNHQVSIQSLPVRCATRVCELLTDGAGRVCGAVVETDASLQQIGVRAGVVLACGGFAYAEELKRAYLSPGRAGALGWPGKR